MNTNFQADSAILREVRPQTLNLTSVFCFTFFSLKAALLIIIVQDLVVKRPPVDVDDIYF